MKKRNINLLFGTVWVLILYAAFMFLPGRIVFAEEKVSKKVLEGVSYLCKEGKYRGGLLVLENYTPSEELYAQYFYWKARCCMGRYEYEKGFDCIEKSLNKEPANTVFLLCAAKCAIGLKNYENSIVLFGEALKIDKDNPLLLARQALVFMSAGKREEAYRNIHRAESILPNNSLILFCKAHIFYEDKKCGESLNLLSRCVEICSNNKDDDNWKEWEDNALSKIYAAKARVYFELENYKESLKNINMAIKENRFDGLFFLARARIYSEMGDIKNALLDLDSAADLSPGLEETVQKRKDMISEKLTNIFP